MVQVYFTKRRWLYALFLFAAIAPNFLFAQINATPFEQVFVTANLDKETLKKDFPHLYSVVKNKDYKTEDVNSFIQSYQTEWSSFCNLPALKKLNIAWITLGITSAEIKKPFPHSMYQWYKAANISDAKKNQLFPHFPLPNLKNDADKELADYYQKIGVWQRLYTEEYERFLNSPELTALNPYYKGYYQLPYIPKFVGSAITQQKPDKQNTGNAIMDEYNHQLKLRNWYFVFKPEIFEHLYGKDYKFPKDFDGAAYRHIVITKLNEKKDGTTSPADNH